MLPQVACDKHAAAKREVRSTWDSYVKANSERRGIEVAGLLSKGTIEHYTKLVKAGLDMPAKDCWNLPPTQMYEVLKMRNRFKRSELKGIDGKGYLVISASRGWNNDDDPDWTLTDIKVTEDRASAQIHNAEWEAAYARDRAAGALTRRGRLGWRVEKPPRYPIELTKEGDIWKIDGTSVLPRQDQELRDFAKDSRMSVRDFLMELEAINTDQGKIPFTVWEPKK
jgi:hypothetical protein